MGWAVRTRAEPRSWAGARGLAGAGRQDRVAWRVTARVERRAIPGSNGDRWNSLAAEARF